MGEVAVGMNCGIAGVGTAVDVAGWFEWTSGGERADGEDVGHFCWRRARGLLLFLLRLLVMIWGILWLKLRRKSSGISRVTAPDWCRWIVGS